MKASQTQLEEEAFLRQEVQRGLAQLDQGQRADFNAEKIISEERRRLAGETEDRPGPVR